MPLGITGGSQLKIMEVMVTMAVKLLGGPGAGEEGGKGRGGGKEEEEEEEEGK